MAKLKMKCIELLAPLEQSKEIIDCLQRMGTVELTDCEESESLCKPVSYTHLTLPTT